MNSLVKLANKAKVRAGSRWWLPALLGIVILFFPFPARPGQPVERVLRVEASRFAYSPSIIKVNQGDRITLELVSTDVVHGLAVDGYGLAVTADPGQTARLTFIANRSGSFRFRCSATCGPLHPFMIGKIQVGDNTLWWRAAGLALLAVVAVFWRRLT
jgi:heme/copper-type cytochrome/quinol oxidase subunit 2